MCRENKLPTGQYDYCSFFKHVITIYTLGKVHLILAPVLQAHLNNIIVFVFVLFFHCGNVGVPVLHTQS